MASREELLISRSRTLRSRRAEAARSFKWSILDFPGGGWEGFAGDWGWEKGRGEEVGEGDLGCGGENDAGAFWGPDEGESWKLDGEVVLKSVGGDFLYPAGEISE